MTDQYLPSAAEMQHAIQLLLASELFRFYHERMVGLIMVDAQEVSLHQVNRC